jgi:hypothetical protein
MENVRWLFDCSYTLWREGNLSLRTSLAWAKKLKSQFGDHWTGRQAAEYQLSKWKD